MLVHSAADSHRYAMRLPIQYGVCSPVRGKPRMECQVQDVPITHRSKNQFHSRLQPMQPQHEYCCSLKSRRAEYAAFPVPEGYTVLAVGCDFAKAKSVRPTIPARTLRFGQLSLLTDKALYKIDQHFLSRLLAALPRSPSAFQRSAFCFFLKKAERPPKLDHESERGSLRYKLNTPAPSP